MAGSMKMGGVEIEWLGHAGFRLKAEGRVVYIDPFKIGGGEKADLILITHDHYDHCDPGSVDALMKEGTVIVAAGPCKSNIPDAMAVKPGDSLSAAGTEIRAVHAYNLDKPYHPKGNGVGFLVTIAGNVPLNDTLDRATPGRAAWHDYLGSWLAFNHVRAVTGLAALVLLLIALNQD